MLMRDLPGTFVAVAITMVEVAMGTMVAVVMEVAEEMMVSEPVFLLDLHVYRLMRCVYPQTIDVERILKRLDKLQHTSANLPKEKVLSRIRNYLQLVGRKVDEIVQQHEFRMIKRLWNYDFTFSNLSGASANIF